MNKQPSKSILDRSFVYVPSTATSVDQTWRRFGWRPVTEAGTLRDERGLASQSPQPAGATQ